MIKQILEPLTWVIATIAFIIGLRLFVHRVWPWPVVHPEAVVQEVNPDFWTNIEIHPVVTTNASGVLEADGTMKIETNRWQEFKPDYSVTNKNFVGQWIIGAPGCTNWFAGESFELEARVFTKNITLDLEDDRGTIEIDMARRWRPYYETGETLTNDVRLMPPYSGGHRLLIMLPDGHWMTITPNLK